MYDPDSNEGVFADREGRLLNRRPADQLTAERVMGLDVSQRRSWPDGHMRSNLVSGFRDQTSCRVTAGGPSLARRAGNPCARPWRKPL
jgi:hypothetical protein